MNSPTPDFDDVVPAEPGLTVLAYHRVGDRDATALDPWVITAHQEQLAAQIQFFRKHHRIVGMEEALEIADGRVPPFGRAVLITFDDGYLDNYQTAYPVLRSLGVEGTFFLVSGFLSEGLSAWWDRMAWQIRAAKGTVFHLPVGSEIRTIDASEMSESEAITVILELYKSCPAETMDQFAASLEAAVPPGLNFPSDRMFLNVDEAREMRAGGMVIGAHTRSHSILARLSPSEQQRELSHSRAVLEQQLGATIDILAYPVGGPSDFNATTQRLAAECGYRAAFSCHGGINVLGQVNRFDIKRTAVYWDAQPEWLLED